MRTIHIFFALFIAFLASSTNAKVYAAGGDQDPNAAVMHHISDAHGFHIVGDLSLPLPCIAYDPEKGFFFAMSSAFDHGTKAVDNYMIYHDVLYQIKGFDKEGIVDLSEPTPHHGGNGQETQTVDQNGVHGGEADHSNLHGAQVSKTDDVLALNYKGASYELVPASSVQGVTNWFDFSITKNVFTMFFAFAILLVIFTIVKNAYKTRPNQAPKGLQSAIEVVICFIRDEVAIPSLGDKWKKFFPFLLSLFFFILVNNLLGLVPFFPGSANVTGNLGTTLVLATFTFIVVNINGNKDYWQHVFWMPGIPIPIRLLLAVIETASLFLKPITLMIRLFANITAGHIIILSLVSLIFVFHRDGILGGAIGGVTIALPFVFALNLLEILVSFVQAFLFTMLSAVYIGAAIEEHHHDDHHEEAHAAH